MTRLLPLLLLSACMATAPRSTGEARDHPTPIGREHYDWNCPQGYVRTEQQPLSTFAIDVDTASYSHVRRYLEQRRMPPPNAVRIEEMINAFEYDDPRPREEPVALHVAVGAAPWAPMHRLVRVAITGKEVPPRERPDANLVFLLDVSGSMEDDDKLPLVKDAMLTLLDELEPRDTVAIVTYRSGARIALPPTSVRQRRTIERAISKLQASGWTNGSAGIDCAYEVAEDALLENGVNRVILATDGDFNRGTTQAWSLERLIRKKARSGVYLTCLGVGQGNLNDANLEALADHGNGHYAYLRSRADARRVLSQQLEQTLVAVARDVKVQVEFNPARVRSYRLIGYENRMIAARDFANEIADGGELGAGQSTVALYEVVPIELSQAGVEPLRYGEAAPEGGSDELLTVKVRYHDPESDRSTRLVRPIADRPAELSADFRFTAGVAAFGMLLRDDPHRGACTYELVESLTGRRDGELRSLVRTASRLQ
ncbi:MAG: vWA domain-containing protein [Planctomycetota bacterium]|jgi:Ca-activated chloride channel family protein